MRAFLKHFIIYIFILMGACQPRSSASKIDSLSVEVQEVVLRKNWNGIERLSINPQDAKHIDRTIIFAPSNGKLMQSRYLPASAAENEWPEARHLLKKTFRVDYVLLLKWEYPTENGPAEIQQFFAIHEVNHRYLIVF